MSIQKMYKMYSIGQYSQGTKTFIDKSYKEYNLKDIITLLKKDNAYHIRVHETNNYTFFGDLDKYDKSIEEFKEIITNFLLTNYDITITINDIVHTQNDTTKGSFHYSIPLLYCSCLKLKEIHTNLKKILPAIDTTIYAEHWFRLPNQSKEPKKKPNNSKSGIHRIISGTIKDHFVEYINKNSICIESNKLTVNYLNNEENIKKNDDIDEDIKDEHLNIIIQNKVNIKIVHELLSILNKKRNDNFDEWIKIGFIFFDLNNNNNDLSINYFNIWSDWSKQSNKYTEGCCEHFWKQFKQKDNKLTVKSLYYYAKIDNEIEYNNIIKKNRKQITSDDILKLNELYNKVDEGYVAIYHEKYKEDLVCISIKTHSFLLYNDTTQLWEQKTSEEIQLHFIKNIKILIEPLVNYYKEKANKIRDTYIDKAKEYDKRSLKIKNTGEFNKLPKVKGLMGAISAIFYNQEILKKLNNEKDLLPVKTGVISLKTGEFRKRTKEDYFSFELNVIWKGLEYETPDINKFFDDIMLNDTDMILYLQKLLGYSISGHVNEQRFIIFYGVGGNSKGVLQNILKILMGDYYRQLTSDVIMESRKNSAGAASPHLMQLLGARLAFVDESELGGKLNEGTVKSITGGSSITARPLFCNPITFEPSFQLFLLTNHKPEIAVNQSMERRLILIPFLAEFKNKDKYDENNEKHRLGNPDIEVELLQKLDQLLVWLVNGSVRYFKEKLDNVPNKVNTATNEYLQENNDLDNFLNEICIIKTDGFIYHNTLIEKYKNEYDKNITQKMFTTMMKEKGYESLRKTKGMGFKGIELK